MIVHVHTTDQIRPRFIHGPADLGTTGHGATLVVAGTPTDRDPARWASAIGAAVLRGANVIRKEP